MRDRNRRCRETGKVMWRTRAAATEALEQCARMRREKRRARVRATAEA